MARGRRIQSQIDEKIKQTFDDIIFDLGTDWATIIREALLSFLPTLEERAKIVKSRKYPKNPSSVT